MKSISDLKKFFGQIMNTKILVIIFIVGIGLMMLPSGGTEEKRGGGAADKRHGI